MLQSLVMQPSLHRQTDSPNTCVLCLVATRKEGESQVAAKLERSSNVDRGDMLDHTDVLLSDLSYLNWWPPSLVDSTALVLKNRSISE